ncbi:MAG: dephospho-CoA kinase [Bacteroidales bacterium]|jgi:dephospho-CoA kinase|nr:dephospho-CoA kinase [Bacteroidales bacterium]
MTKATLSIGLTGGIGSGKSLIAGVFESIGVPVFFADDYAKKSYEDWDFVQEIARVISPKVIVGGKFSKTELANVIFTDRKKRLMLNSLVHPKVLSAYNEWLSEQETPYALMESAIIYEIGWQGRFAKTICVNTPLNIVIDRIMKRDKITKEQAMERIQAQMATEEKVALADYVIQHDNMTMLLPQILEIDSDIRKLTTNNK